MRGAALVDVQRQRFQPRDQVAADEFPRLFLADVDVVAGVGLGRRGEDRLRQTIRLAQAGRKLHAAHAARSVGTPSIPTRKDTRARHIRSEPGRFFVRTSSGRGGVRHVGARPPGSRRDRSRSSDGRRDRPCARTRTLRAASAPCPCQEFRSRARSRTPRCDRWRRSRVRRRPRRRRVLSRVCAASGRRAWFREEERWRARFASRPPRGKRNGVSADQPPQELRLVRRRLGDGGSAPREGGKGGSLQLRTKRVN